MPLAEYNENSGFYWLDSSHAYTFNGTEEERAQHEKQLKEQIQLERELNELAEAGKLNAFLRKYGLVTYRCKRGCLLGAVFNHRGTKYFYSWQRTLKEVTDVAPIGLSIKREAVKALAVRHYERELKGELKSFVGGECRHVDACLTSADIVADVEALKRADKKTVYLPRP